MRKNYVRVYRGVQDTTGKWSGNPETQQTGMHWTTDPTVAYHFARHGDLIGEHEELNGEDLGPEGIPHEPAHPGAKVLEGWVHKKNIVAPKSREWQDLSDIESIYSPEHNEQEVTVRPGAHARVSKIHHVGAQFAHQFGVTEFGIPKKVGIYNRDDIKEGKSRKFKPVDTSGHNPADILDAETYEEIYGVKHPDTQL